MTLYTEACTVVRTDAGCVAEWRASLLDCDKGKGVQANSVQCTVCKVIDSQAVAVVVTC